MTTRATGAGAGDATGEFPRILVPLDGSPQSERAIAEAAHLDVARITLLRVDPGDPYDPDAPDDDIYGQWLRDHHDDLQRYLDDLARTHADAAGSIETVIRYGDPSEQIIAAGREHDLIVMSSSGRGAAGRLLFGSTADRVMRHADTPVMIVRTGGEGVAVGRPERVVVPLDGSELAEEALPIAIRVAGMLGAPVHLMRCVGMEEVLGALRVARRSEERQVFEQDPDPYETMRQRVQDEASAYLTEIAGRMGDGLTVTTEVLGGAAAFELLWAIADPDLVVMTSRGRGGYERWVVGSVAEKLVREAKAPVLLVPVRRDERD